ncbi:hypothetical protein EVAR_55378_1 [Eumeta japonica]|uniref:Uncharacterized protein n=1 Tax=Eumeta variegata TaxID=151549 RepID=A0A4C1YVT0_EUMVA|nr:hypothetical protein EVAR_55378_1 [Eumeta japonica]
MGQLDRWSPSLVDTRNPSSHQRIADLLDKNGRRAKGGVEGENAMLERSGVVKKSKIMEGRSLLRSNKFRNGVQIKISDVLSQLRRRVSAVDGRSRSAKGLLHYASEALRRSPT